MSDFLFDRTQVILAVAWIACQVITVVAFGVMVYALTLVR